MTNFTKPDNEFSYTGDYPPMVEFEKPWESAIQVGQGHAYLSSEGRPLQSEGFSKCSALILKNEKTLESALFHISDFDLVVQQEKIVEQFMTEYISGLDIEFSEKERLLSAVRDISHYRYPESMRREDFQKRMQKLNIDNKIRAQYITGTGSRDIVTRLRESMFDYFGVMIEEVSVDTGDYHWAVVYKPLEGKTYVQSESQKKVLVFNF